MPAATIPFLKYQATGNDFVLLHAAEVAGCDWDTLAPALCDRRTGVGADQVLVLHGSTVAGVRLEVRNADGSPGEMCGNGLRAVALHLRRDGQPGPWRIETAERIVVIEPADTDFAANLGPPGPVTEQTLDLPDTTVTVDCVSMGNPHAVLRCPDAAAIPLAERGPQIERHPRFPDGTNVHFVTVASPHRVRAFPWERGSGATPACGSGAAAIAVICATRGATQRQVEIQYPGGLLRVDWRQDGDVRVTGPARRVFAGTLARADLDGAQDQPGPPRQS